jgi:hypothetical protein
MSWQPISEGELSEIVAEQLLRLDPEAEVRWHRYKVGSPQPMLCVRDTVSGAPGEPEPIYALARSGDAVLIYDDVEDEFGTGIIDPDGVLRTWGTFGEDLRWALASFPGPSAP